MSDEEYLEIMKAGKAAPEVSPMAVARSLGPQTGTAHSIDGRPRVKLTLLVCLWWQGLGGVERVEGRGNGKKRTREDFLYDLRTAVLLLLSLYIYDDDEKYQYIV